MKTLLSQIDVVIECRDNRIPITSRNPMFEEVLAGRERIIVYTKRDLVGNGKTEEELKVRWLGRTVVATTQALMRYILCRRDNA